MLRILGFLPSFFHLMVGVGYPTAAHSNTVVPPLNTVVFRGMPTNSSLILSMAEPENVSEKKLQLKLEISLK